MKSRVFHMAGVLIWISVGLLSCGSQEPEQPGPGWEEKARDVTTALMSRYDPVLFPPEGFAERRVFTHNLQEFLVNPEGKPVLFDGFLDDITKEGTQMFVHFTSRLSPDPADERTVRFQLSCDYSDVESLVQHPPRYARSAKYLFLKGIRKDFLVVCMVTDVERIMNYTVAGRCSENSTRADLEIQSPDTFGARGRLLEMIKYSDLHGTTSP